MTEDDPCCPCYSGCPDCEHTCGLPPEEAERSRQAMNDQIERVLRGEQDNEF